MSAIEFVGLGDEKARVMQGDAVVIVEIEGLEHASIGLSPEEAERMALRLVLAAEFAREPKRRREQEAEG